MARILTTRDNNEETTFFPSVRLEVHVTLKDEFGPAHSYSSVVLCQALVGPRIPERDTRKLKSSICAHGKPVTCHQRIKSQHMSNKIRSESDRVLWIPLSPLKMLKVLRIFSQSWTSSNRVNVNVGNIIYCRLPQCKFFHERPNAQVSSSISI